MAQDLSNERQVAHGPFSSLIDHLELAARDSMLLYAVERKVVSGHAQQSQSGA